MSSRLQGELKAEQDADGNARQRGVADRLGEKREALDHHQRAETAEHRADQQAGHCCQRAGQAPATVAQHHRQVDNVWARQ